MPWPTKLIVMLMAAYTIRRQVRNRTSESALTWLYLRTEVRKPTAISARTQVVQLMPKGKWLLLCIYYMTSSSLQIWNSRTWGLTTIIMRAAMQSGWKSADPPSLAPITLINHKMKASKRFIGPILNSRAWVLMEVFASLSKLRWGIICTKSLRKWSFLKTDKLQLIKYS